MKNLRSVFLVATILLISSCENTFENFGETDTDAAILYQAKLYLAEGEWDNAIAEFVKLPAATLALPDVLVEHASAYSGKCGLDFIELMDQIDNLGSTSVMQMLMNTFTATTAAKFNHCKTAETMLKTIATAGVVSTERGRYLMAFSSLAKIGAIITYRGDSDTDNTPDATFDPCDNADGLTDLPDADADEIVTGIALFKHNIENLEIGEDVYDDLDTLCTAMPVGYEFCDAVNVGSVTANYRLAARAIIMDGVDGFGLNIGNNGMDTATNAALCSPN